MKPCGTIYPRKQTKCKLKTVTNLYYLSHSKKKRNKNSTKKPIIKLFVRLVRIFDTLSDAM